MRLGINVFSSLLTLLARGGPDVRALKKRFEGKTDCFAAYYTANIQHFCFLQGSVFFALPDGNGLLYNVTGSAEGPKPVNNIQREVPCKTFYTEMLTVTNWLRRPQRFAQFFVFFHLPWDYVFDCVLTSLALWLLII